MENTTHRFLALFDDAARVQTLGNATANALRVFDALRNQPLATLNDLSERTGAWLLKAPPSALDASRLP